MSTKTEIADNQTAFRMETLHNLFCASIRNRRYVPGRRDFNETVEKRRESAGFEVIDDYIEQA